MKIGWELFELIEYYTDRHTHRQIHADENNTSPKTKFLGEVIKHNENIADNSHISYGNSTNGKTIQN